MESCPCGSNEHYHNCCQPVIEGKTIAETPSQLMRSRYCAYVKGDMSYIFKTYVKAMQNKLTQAELSEDAKNTTWIKLTIHDAPIAENEKGQVEFSAFYLVANDLYEMRERSNFIKENHNWRYLDGDITRHELINTIKRNDLCPCGSGRKFKKCCIT